MCDRSYSRLSAGGLPYCAEDALAVAGCPPPPYALSTQLSTHVRASRGCPPTLSDNAYQAKTTRGRAFVTNVLSTVPYRLLYTVINGMVPCSVLYYIYDERYYYFILYAPSTPGPRCGSTGQLPGCCVAAALVILSPRRGFVVGSVRVIRLPCSEARGRAVQRPLPSPLRPGAWVTGHCMVCKPRSKSQRR